MVRAVDDRLPDSIAFLGVKEVNDDWNPRLASNRVYRYRLEGMQGWQYPGEKFNNWLNLFVGTYDATNFARLEEGKKIPFGKFSLAHLGSSIIELLDLK